MGNCEIKAAVHLFRSSELVKNESAEDYSTTNSTRPVISYSIPSGKF